MYDFRNPPHGGAGFHWTDVDENATNWTFEEYAEGLSHPLAERQFKADMEAGWMAGKGKKAVVYIPEMQEPELMYKLFDKVVGNTYDLIRFFEPNKVPKKMTEDEMDILWEESGRKQDKMMAEVKAAHGEPFEPSPMIQRMLDGSDIVARDEE